MDDLRGGGSACHGHRGSAFRGLVECSASLIRQRPQRGGRYRYSGRSKTRSTVIGPRGHARNVRTIKADVGQFTIAKLGQLAVVTLIIPERLDHSNERN